MNIDPPLHWRHEELACLEGHCPSATAREMNWSSPLEKLGPSQPMLSSREVTTRKKPYQFEPVSSGFGGHLG